MADAVGRSGTEPYERGPRQPSRRSLEDRARRAQRPAVDRLFEQRHTPAAWKQDFDLCALSGALYVLFLRLTGLIDTPSAEGDEARVIRHLITQTNPEGGFHKYPGSPSCRNISVLASLALRMALGSVECRGRPRGWFRANGCMDATLRRRIDGVLARAAGSTRIRGGGDRRVVEADLGLTRRLLEGCVDRSSMVPPIPLLGPEFVAWAERNWGLAAVLENTSTLTRRMVPSHSILYRCAARRSPGVGRVLAFLDRSDVWRRREGRSLDELALLIASRQNENGGWFYSPLCTMVNSIALAERGSTPDDLILRRAHEYVRSAMFPTDDGGVGISIATPDLWDTSSAVIALLEQPERRAEDPEIRPSVEFLLASAGPDGGFAWGSGSSNDTDSDSTGSVLRALAVANRTAGPELGRSLDPVMRSAVRYLTDRQDRRGGFSVWRPCLLPARPGSMGFRTQQFFDLATADTTGRVLAAFCAAGLTWRDRPVRRAVRDLIRLQHRNGGWWCRWCAGYIPGTFFVLEALAALDLKCGVVPNGGDRLKSAAYRSMVRGAEFLRAHQNEDGGWGETTLADTDDRWAGVGESRPLQTALALIGLIGCGNSTDSSEVDRGVGWLLDSMDREESWHDDQAVFSLFSRAWYYRYPLYNFIMPLRALTAYLRAIDSQRSRPS